MDLKGQWPGRAHGGEPRIRHASTCALMQVSKQEKVHQWWEGVLLNLLSGGCKGGRGRGQRAAEGASMEVGYRHRLGTGLTMLSKRASKEVCMCAHGSTLCDDVHCA